jgi:hypothetical protein
MAAYDATLELGDTILGTDLSHSSPVSFSGKQFKFASYHVDPDRGGFPSLKVAFSEHEKRQSLRVDAVRLPFWGPGAGASEAYRRSVPHAESAAPGVSDRL